MEPMYYIGLDVHKKKISYCVKDVSGRIHLEGAVAATRTDLDLWMKALPQPWTAAMEATIFTGWIYDYLLPHAAALKVAHPLMLRAIAAAKKKNDRIDAGRIADCLRCDFLPECYMAPMEIRQRRRTLRYRKPLVRQMNVAHKYGQFRFSVSPCGMSVTKGSHSLDVCVYSASSRKGSASANSAAPSI